MILTYTYACSCLDEKPVLSSQAHGQVARKSPLTNQNLDKEFACHSAKKRQSPVANSGSYTIASLLFYKKITFKFELFFLGKYKVKMATVHSRKPLGGNPYGLST